MRDRSKDNYDDIINLPHHVSSRHPRMSMAERAAQFSPFAALTGYGDVIQETARLTDAMPELTAEEKAELDQKLRMALDCPGRKPVLTVTYFVPDKKKSGGAFQTASGRIIKSDPYEHSITLENGIRIDIDCILDIDGEIYSR